MRFFEPTARFLDWAAANLRGRALFDVGAGDGHVAQALSAVGLSVTALDILPSGSAVLRVDGTVFPYPTGCTVMICRPCHGDFPRAVVQQATTRRVAQVLYCGLRRNVRGDLSDVRARFDHVLAGAGKAGESVWRWKLAQGTMNVALVQWYPFPKPFWVEDQDDGWWYHRAGGQMRKTRDDIIHETTTVPAGDWRALDWKKTGFYDPTSSVGWLSPSGEFFGCGSQEHDTVADLILKSTVHGLETAGWVRVDRAGQLGSMTYRCFRALTAEQRVWLGARGHDLEYDGADPLDEERDRRAYESLLARADRRR